MLLVVGIDLIGKLLPGLLGLVVVALALKELHDLVLADVHERSLQGIWNGRMRLDSARRLGRRLTGLLAFVFAAG